jgi:7-cyano-7-deazaguanine synthase
MKQSALILFSGGIDSTTALYWARRRFAPVTVLTVAYGQRHGLETDMAEKTARHLDVPFVRLELPLASFLESALLDENRAIPDSRAAAKKEKDVPDTYVPFRNGIFLAVAAAWAETRGVRHLVTGFNAVDTPDYPDTTARFTRRMQAALNAGTSAALDGRKFRIHAPLLALSKTDIIRLGLKLKADYSRSISCYRGAETPCGRCPSCDIRGRAFAELGVEDPLLARLRRERHP